MSPPLAITVGHAVFDFDYALNALRPGRQWGIGIEADFMPGRLFITGDHGGLTPAECRALAAWLEACAQYLEATDANHD